MDARAGGLAWIFRFTPICQSVKGMLKLRLTVLQRSAGVLFRRSLQRGDKMQAGPAVSPFPTAHCMILVLEDSPLHPAATKREQRVSRATAAASDLRHCPCPCSREGLLR